ncbi:MAG: permease [Cyclonatronaceae bacterium]
MFEWIQLLADWIIYSLAGVEEGTALGDSLTFFIYDVIKILILLYLISFFMGLVNAWFPVERIRDFINSRKLYGTEYFFAAFFGAITPFCSCSSVPLFIGFVRGGIPLGVTFSFLITSPLVNEVALAIFLGAFGWQLTLIYALTGIFLGTVGGFVLGKFKLDHLLTDWVKKLQTSAAKPADKAPEAEEAPAGVQTAGVSLRLDSPFVQRLRSELPTAAREANSIVKSVLLYVIIGIGVGAAMHGFVPEGFFEQYIGADTWYAVPLAVIFAVPLYANAASIVPIVQVFVAKGIPIGTAIAFMMATIGLSLPEATLLKKVMTMKLIAIFFGVVTFFIMLSGFLFNLVL